MPLLKLPKPNASFFGFGNNELGFFHIPEFDYRLETPDPAPDCSDQSDWGKLSPEAVQAELARFITKEWVWEALPHSDDSFLVVFPSVDELNRMADVEFTLKNHGVTLTISEWKDASDVEPSYQLDEVWVHVRGVPHTWRHYLGFWALGSVIDATLDVDMYTYRKMGIIKLLVGVMNRDPLPLTTDIVFDKKGYEITYSMEDKNFIPASPVIFREESRNDGGGGMDKDSEQEDKSPEHAFKKHKIDGKGGGASSMAEGLGDGEDTPMLGAAAISPLETAIEPVPTVMKDFPMLHMSTLHAICPLLHG